MFDNRPSNNVFDVNVFDDNMFDVNVFDDNMFDVNVLNNMFKLDKYKCNTITTEIIKLKEDGTIFNEIPSELLHLSYNMLYICAIANYSNSDKSKVSYKVIKHTKTIIEIIIEAAEEIENKELFYRMISNNHIITMQSYMIKHAGKKLVSDEGSKKSTMKLMELTEDKKYSNLQRALDIISQDITIMSKEDEDIMKTFNSISKYNEINDFLINSVYDSIYNDNNGIKSYDIFNIYWQMYTMCLSRYIDTEFEITLIRRYLNQLYTADKIAVQKSIKHSKVLKTVSTYGVSTDTITNKVVNNYLNALKSNIDGVIYKKMDKKTDRIEKLKQIKIREKAVRKKREREMEAEAEKRKRKREREIEAEKKRMKEFEESVAKEVEEIKQRVNKEIEEQMNNKIKIERKKYIATIIIIFMLILNFISMLYYNKKASNTTSTN
ncbi:hypothetical protein NEPAR08_1124 [Nematocida parisii]|nr:hypothetical protein NEPAR03_0508 [Nematocida parisii]KAI5128260.1 hypothetical protein NEPAR08_1124 [Nematocida parisii]